ALPISAACTPMRERMGPAALLVREGTFERYTLRGDRPNEFPMTREDAVKAIADALGADDVVVSTTGKTSRELFEHRKATGVPGNDFLTVGGMGHTASIAMGLARSQPARRVVCLDGDGSAIMHMGALAVIGNSALENLLHVVINNGSHESVGGQPTVGYDIDFPAIARACGYRHAASVSSLDLLVASVAELRQASGPALLEVKVRIGSRADLGRPTSTPLDNRDALMKRLGLWSLCSAYQCAPKPRAYNDRHVRAVLGLPQSGQGRLRAGRAEAAGRVRRLRARRARHVARLCTARARRDDRSRARRSSRRRRRRRRAEPGAHARRGARRAPSPPLARRADRARRRQYDRYGQGPRPLAGAAGRHAARATLRRRCQGPRRAAADRDSDDVRHRRRGHAVRHGLGLRRAQEALGR